jgi:acetyl-CoA carboxylase alpha subunit
MTKCVICGNHNYNFKEIVSGFITKDPENHKLLRRTFGVSKPTVDRWANGINEPQDPLKPPIIKFINDRT